MDNFMDKIAQKLGAQEAIRANAAADAAQMAKMEEQVAQYDACMKEMRRLNLKNVENEEKIKEILKESSQRIQEELTRGSEQLEMLFQKNSEQIQKLTDECIEKIKSTQTEVWDEAKEAVLNARDNEDAVGTLLEQLKEAAAADKEKMEEMFRQSDDFAHTENVKVYRNVQAALVEELEKQTQELMSSQQQLASKNKLAFVMNVVTLAAVVGNLAMLTAHLLGVF